MMNILKYLLVITVLTVSSKLSAQDAAINWLNFEQLEDSLSVKPKKVFIDFYAEWCTYCKKMDKAAFKVPEIVSKLNSEYYAVKMNVETSDTIIFEGQKYLNKDFGKKRNAIHEIPLLLASREGIPFSLPAIIMFDESFTVTHRYFEYLAPKRMLEILKK
ncbi:MAG: thioredoxin fold domain-containing protein [Saonia sp.]